MQIVSVRDNNNQITRPAPAETVTNQVNRFRKLGIPVEANVAVALLHRLAPQIAELDWEHRMTLQDLGGDPLDLSAGAMGTAIVDDLRAALADLHQVCLREVAADSNSRTAVMVAALMVWAATAPLVK